MGLLIIPMHMLGLLLWLAGMAYLLLSAWALGGAQMNACDVDAPINAALALTLLKPLCGAEPQLEQCLRSFCGQAYPGPLQIIFGVQSAIDPALTIARRLAAEFADRDIEIVVDPTVWGPNGKVSNLANMAPVAKHGLIAVSDSDVRAEPDCLRRVAERFGDPTVGAVTSLYCGAPAPGTGWVGAMGALQINGWFLPSSVLAARLWPVDSCFGPLTIIRRSVLDAAGGFPAIADVLADDHALGQITVAQGRRVELAPVTVDTLVQESSLGLLLRHELRWAVTTRVSMPAAYLVSVVTWPTPLIAALMLVRFTGWDLAALAALFCLRSVVVLMAQAKIRGGARSGFGLLTLPAIMVREVLCFAVWLAGLFSSRMIWRGRAFRIAKGGRIIEAVIDTAARTSAGSPGPYHAG